MSAQSSVLFDAPGPKARRRNALYTVVTVFLALIGLAVLYLGFNGTLRDTGFSLFNPLTWGPLGDPATWAVNPAGEWASDKWAPFLQPATWTDYVVPGLQNTLTAALTASVLAILFGLVFGIGRLSDKWWIRVPAGAVVEFFRGIPLLMLIFFTMALPIVAYQMFDIPAGTFQVSALAAVVTGLTLYNGSVLAEVFRAGVLAVPKGQSEAAQAIGMTRGQNMRLILIPQAITAMMPAIVAQLVVLLKDSALGYIIAFPEMLRSFTLLATREGNVIPAAIICAAIYIAINLSLSRVAIWLERRNARRGRPSAKPTGGGDIPAQPVAAPGGGTGDGSAKAEGPAGSVAVEPTVQEPLPDALDGSRPAKSGDGDDPDGRADRKD
ncbi:MULTISPECIES: amino acid ABC transporter permease [Nocardiopsis]|uniref:Polar amino acid ABC transporter, inner membrane subunit n=1 Tax=Nocardiopsis dassonvillei (strain ATCC 23218 / DSM 43111 / CIP 107115 / JCM 7437 / KCTC 9190 / NBRC 14626 / NCTC 10488 / NRRL B-5397 / IMRU 509) TaxID=446468 RepID=D7AYC9_NOCDD|nr:amino acid ABC transporter permease [Nocardiopsis dassonvillei]ADH66114.1 polar amino acid ABC transporter, inner membrane subunit [Nocardiopsis dassonvillei subsp. dassonvillei DSM 43111]NKY78663.1 amino acid ABC transporter permease [Nocardiopsis dassonvillei]VEI92134.1 Glutamate/aspartate transport system permease protein gltK [Nocardiopsis dassonvillei]